MVFFRKRLTSEILYEINEMIISKLKSDSNDKDNHNGGNGIGDGKE